MSTTAQSETGALRSVLLRHPRDAYRSAERIAAQWRELNYHAAPELSQAVAEFEGLAAVLAGAGAEVRLAGEHDETRGSSGRDADEGAPGATLDSIYVRDAALMTDGGAILCAMGKAARAAEPIALRRDLEAAGVPILGAITGEGRVEGGDVCWLPGNRLAVGRGYRTNAEGIRQLRELTRDLVAELAVVPLPHWRGPADVFHLMSILSPVANDAVLVHAPLLTVPFREWLLDCGLQLIEVHGDEFDTMACNVLALAPGKCLMLDGNPRTRERLETAGIEVIEYAGDEISRKGEGGPTCLTRPLVREQ